MERLNYKEYSDEKLVTLSRNGDKRAEEFLLTKYKNFVRSKARAYFLVGGDNDDLIQEGMIGLYNAIGSFDEDKEATFMTYAALCINNKILSAVAADNRHKNEPLNKYISIYSMVSGDNGEEAVLSDVLPSSKIDNPEDIVLSQEQKEIIEDKMEQRLSSLEKKILSYYIEGLSYAQIADRVDKSPKAVDNAIQRIRAKLKKSM